jgi:hypothetical protein
VNRSSLLMIVFILLIVGGFLTTSLANGDESSILPFVEQTSDPAASVLQAEPWQAERLFLLSMLVVVSMLAIGSFIAFVMLSLDTQIEIAHSLPVNSRNDIRNSE